MSVSNLPHGTVQYRQPDEDGHLSQVGQWLRAERAANSRRLVDVHVQVDGQTDHLHSAVAFPHSARLRELIATRGLPLTVEMSGFRPRSVFRVIDWMYGLDVELSKTNIGEDLAAAAFFGVDSLHRLLEGTFRQMAAESEYRVLCFNLANDERCQVSPPSFILHSQLQISPQVAGRLLVDLAEQHDALSTQDIRRLHARSVAGLLAADVPFKQKIDLLNLALLWLRFDSNMRHVDGVLPHLRIRDFGSTSTKELAEHLRDILTLLTRSLQDMAFLNVYTRNGNTVVVSRDPQKFLANGGVVVTPTEDDTCRSGKSSAGIAKLPPIGRSDDRLARYAHEQPAASDTDSQAIVNKRMFSDEDLIDYAGLPADGALFDKNASVRRRDGRPVRLPPPIGTPPARGSYFFGGEGARDRRADLLPSIMTADPQVPPLPAEKHQFPRPQSPGGIPSVAYMVRPEAPEFARPSGPSTLRSDAYVVGKHAFARPSGPAELDSDAYAVSEGGSPREALARQKLKGMPPLPNSDKPDPFACSPKNKYCHRSRSPVHSKSPAKSCASRPQLSSSDVNSLRRLPNVFGGSAAATSPAQSGALLSTTDVEEIKQLPDVFDQPRRSQAAGKKPGASTGVEDSAQGLNASQQHSAAKKPSKQPPAVPSASRSSYLGLQTGPQHSYYAFEAPERK
ncbi:BTB domain-containing protein [Aphelenchoides fujianensis]|nr:BTB domain-containing protein [Aphelenchoides fujianensis]